MQKFLAVLILCHVVRSALCLNCPVYVGLKNEMVANIVECTDNKCFYLEFLDRWNKTKVDRGCIPIYHSSEFCSIQRHNEGFFGRNITVCKVCESTNCNANSSAKIMLSSFVLVASAAFFHRFR